MIKGIIFDMDGTLVDSIPLHFSAWKMTLEKFGIQLDDSLFGEINGMNSPESAEYLVKKFSLDADPKDISDEKRKRSFESMISEKVKLFDGVLDTLILLKGLGFKMGVATSSLRKHLEYELSANLIGFEFDTVVTEEDVEQTKPSPEIFLKCAQRLGCMPEECLVIEDAQNGITAAKNAGMKAVAITNTAPASKFDAADAIITNFKEINTDLIEILGGTKNG